MKEKVLHTRQFQSKYISLDAMSNGQWSRIQTLIHQRDIEEAKGIEGALIKWGA